MSYCVNCGVSLKEDASACPLCDCPVINPYEEYKKYSGGKMPPRPLTDTAPVADWRDLAHFIISLTLALGAVACGVVNLCISGKITWSLIAVAGCITAYVGVCLPMKMRKLIPELSVLFDLLAVLFTVSVIGWYISSSPSRKNATFSATSPSCSFSYPKSFCVNNEFTMQYGDGDNFCVYN